LPQELRRSDRTIGKGEKMEKDKEIIGWEISAEEILAEAFRQEAIEESFADFVSERIKEEIS